METMSPSPQHRENLANALWLQHALAMDQFHGLLEVASQLDSLVREALAGTTDLKALAADSFISVAYLRQIADGGSTLGYLYQHQATYFNE